MSVDKEALRETLDVVIAKAAEGLHDQDIWIGRQTECGTTGCFCGHRALMDGALVIGTNVVQLPGGVVLNSFNFQQWGQQRFGLTEKQSTKLFAGCNDLADLKRIVDEICDTA
jgi:hypothetical protein